MNRRLIAVLAALCAGALIVPLVILFSGPPKTGLVSFESYSELFGYLDRTSGRSAPGYRLPPMAGGQAQFGPTAPVPGGSYSGTNVQVAGIDELDSAKTD